MQSRFFAGLFFIISIELLKYLGTYFGFVYCAKIKIMYKFNNKESGK